MPPRGPAIRSLIAAAGAALCFGAGTAAAQSTRTVLHFPLRLIDLSLAADTLRGLQVLIEPSVQSKQARDGWLAWLRLDPDTVLVWLNSAAAALQVSVPNAPADGIQWSRTLTPLGGRGGVSLGRQRKKGKLDQTRWLAIADSATGWRAELTGTEADSLLQLLLTIAVQARLDTSSAAPYDDYRVDVPVSVVHQPGPKYRGKPGRVVTSYVVDESGGVDSASLVVFLASDPALIPDAWGVLRASRFQPAQLNGKPVRQLVYQVLSWPP